MRKEKKEKMVTRTIATTVCDTLRVTIPDGQTMTHTLTLTGKHVNNRETLEILRSRFDSPEIATAAVISTEVRETLYGMPESVFIANAVILPPRKEGDEESEN